MEIPDDLKYTSSHEWVRMEEDEAVIGITDFAQHQLSDVTFVELPEVGDELSAQEEVAVIESVKAASDIYAPITGTVTAVNAALQDSPETINSDPFGEGWLFKLKPSDPDELNGLLNAAAYRDIAPAD